MGRAPQARDERNYVSIPAGLALLRKAKWMSYLAWMALAGALFLTMALASAYVQRLPVSTALVYLAVGLALGPSGFGVLHFDLVQSAAWFEPLTEGAVIISLFIGGLKLRLPLRDPAWRAPLVLAGPVMVGCIVGVAGFAHLVLGLAPAMSLLLGALLAPTDPVLASAVSVSHAADKSRMRYALSGEAGLNDGMAFPFVALALLWAQHQGPGDWVVTWAMSKLVWAVSVGLLLGFGIGTVIGDLAIRVRSGTRDGLVPTDFLALAVIALAYVAAERIGAWGFLSVFAAGVGFRQAEKKVVAATPHPDRVAKLAARDGEADGDAPNDARAPSHPPAELLVAAHEPNERLKEPAIAAGAMVAETMAFGETSERLLEVFVVVLVGASLSSYFDLTALSISLFLLIALRPAVAMACLGSSPLPRVERPLVAWFGLRGIGSLYYLAYAMNHGLVGNDARLACAITVTTIAASIVLHGISTQPLLDWLGRRRQMRAVAV